MYPNMVSRTLYVPRSKYENIDIFKSLEKKKIELKNLIKMLASLFHSFRKWSGKELWIAVGLRWKLTIYASLLAIVNTTEGKTNISQLQTDPNYLKNVVKKIYFIRSTIHCHIKQAKIQDTDWRFFVHDWSHDPNPKVGTQNSINLSLSPVTAEVRY